MSKLTPFRAALAETWIELLVLPRKLCQLQTFSNLFQLSFDIYDFWILSLEFAVLPWGIENVLIVGVN